MKFQPEKGEKVAKRHHDWFVWPKDQHTNETIARLASQGDYGFEANTLTAVCQDGVRRRLWQITEQDIWILWRSREDLKFEVFNRLGKGAVRNVTFLFKKEPRSPKKRRKKRVPVNPKGKI